MVDNLEIEIKKMDDGYSFSSEDDDRKRIYLIYSPELKGKLREIISPFGILGEGNIMYEGKSSRGDHILYQQGKDDLPDQLTLISREVTEQTKNIDSKELEEKEAKKEEKGSEGWEKWDAEWERTKDLWREQETNSGVSGGSVKHYFCGRDDKGEIVVEGTYIKSETKSQITVLEKSNAPQIKEVSDEEENESNQEEFFFHHQLPSKK